MVKESDRLKSKEDSSRGPGGPDWGVTPRYITKKSPCNVGMASSKPVVRKMNSVATQPPSQGHIRDASRRVRISSQPDIREAAGVCAHWAGPDPTWGLRQTGSGLPR